MLSVLDQENLVTAQQTTAANKPLNQGIRALQPKTPGATKSSFKPRNDENAPLNTGKAIKNAFVTPAPKTIRAPLGAKTTNAKTQAFQTPAPGQKLNKNDQTVKKASTSRRSVRKKIYIEPESVTQPTNVEAELESEDEPDYGYAPPHVEPLPDPPIDFSEIDQAYAALRPENFNRGVGALLPQSPKDENGFSISLKKQEEDYRLSLERDLEKIFQVPTQHIQTSATKSESSKLQLKSQIHASQPSTIKARAAASALSQPSQPRTHQRLPSAATRETAASKQKRKPAFAVAQDQHSMPSAPLPLSNTTIGFPKAKKPASILPTSEKTRIQNKTKHQTASDLNAPAEGSKQLNLSPLKFVQMYGEPSAESDMWCRLMELEIKDRRRERDDESIGQEEMNIFGLDIDEDLDDKLALHGEGDEDFELTLDDL